MLNATFLESAISLKLSTKTAYKKAKETKEDPKFLKIKLQAQIKAGLKISKHFEERVAQRFDESQLQDLIAAICRSINNTKPLEFLRSQHLGVAQKFVDEATNIVVVLERMGEFGASLVTTYVLGKEYLLSEEEKSELTNKGISC